MSRIEQGSNEVPPPATPRTGAGLAIGIAIGVAIGVAMHNLAVGIGVGVALGLGLSSVWARLTSRS